MNRELAYFRNTSIRQVCASQIKPLIGSYIGTGD